MERRSGPNFVQAANWIKHFHTQYGALSYSSTVASLKSHISNHNCKSSYLSLAISAHKPQLAAWCAYLKKQMKILMPAAERFEEIVKGCSSD